MSQERRRAAGRRATDALAPVDVQDAFVALTDGIILTDTEGHIVSANPAALPLLGEDKLVGRLFDELLLVSGATTVQDQEVAIASAAPGSRATIAWACLRWSAPRSANVARCTRCAT